MPQSFSLDMTRIGLKTSQAALRFIKKFLSISKILSVGYGRSPYHSALVPRYIPQYIIRSYTKAMDSIKTGSGVPYHRNINKLHFSPKALEMLSFLELLRLPTMGNTGGKLSLILDAANRSHLEWINSLFCCCLVSKQPRLIIIPRGMVKKNGCTRKACWLAGFFGCRKNFEAILGSFCKT